MTTDDPTLAFYEGNSQKFFNGTVNLNMTVLYSPFLTYMLPSAAILDAGCGSGRDTRYFAERGYKVTAFDYSPALVRLASKLTGQEVLQLSFQEMDFQAQFNGIWACSSLMHVPHKELRDVISRLSRSLKVDGVLYASFRYGAGEHVRDGRLFVDLDEAGFEALIEGHPELAILRCWKSSDLRPDRMDNKWLNVLVRKNRPAGG